MGFLGVTEASAQSVSSAAKSKYEAGVAALSRGDCEGAKALLRQAIAMDAKDRTVRVGMFSTDYYPNAKLREAEARCPTPTQPVATPPAQPTQPAQPAKPPTRPAAAPPTAPPVALSITSPRAASLSVQNATDAATIRGTVRGGSGGLKVAVNGRDIPIARNGSFRAYVSLNVGANEFTINAWDSAKKGATKKIVITRAEKEVTPSPPAEPPKPAAVTAPLELTVVAPSDLKETVPFETTTVTVKGSVKGGKGRHRVTVDNKRATVASDGSFSARVSVKVGVNKITVKATDASRKGEVKQITVTRLEKPAPPIVLSVTAPAESSRSVEFEVDKVTVEGSVTGGEGAHKVTVNDKAVKTDRRGAFSTSVPLDTGDNTIIVKASDSAGKEDSQELRVTRLAKVFPPLVLSIASPSERVQSVPFETDKVTVAGSVKGGEGDRRVTVNGKEASIDSRGAFSASLPLDTGDNIVAVKVKDASGKEEAQEILVTRLAKVIPPLVLNVTSPSERVQSVTSETEKISVSGSVTGGEDPRTVTIGGKEVKTDSRGAFSASVPLDTGDNIVTVKVRDGAGKEEVHEFLVTRLRKVFPPPVLNVTSPPEPVQSVQFETAKIVVGGSAKGGEGALTVTVNNSEVKTDAGGIFSTSIPLDEGSNKITVKVRDEAGKEDAIELHVTRIAKVFPPPVLVVASPVELKQSVEFETDKIDIRGTASGGKGTLKVTVNGEQVETDDGGSFRTSVPINVGDNGITVKVRDDAGREEAKELLVSRRPEEKPRPLVLTVDTPSGIDQGGSVSLRGNVSGGKGQLRLVVDGQTVDVGDAGTFETRIALREGKNRILLWVEDSIGQRESQIWLLFHYPGAAK